MPGLVTGANLSSSPLSGGKQFLNSRDVFVRDFLLFQICWPLACQWGKRSGDGGISLIKSFTGSRLLCLGDYLFRWKNACQDLRRTRISIRFFSTSRYGVF